MSKMDIVITACLRPRVLRQTLTSFCKYLFTNPRHYRVILNVDPIGESNTNWKQVKKVIEDFKFGELVINHPSRASYGAAVIWCWSQVTSPYFFHLEDDWVLLNKVNMDDLISIMEHNNNIAQIRLSKYSNIGMPDEYHHVLVADGCRPRLNPCITRKAFTDSVIRYMTPYSNPEKQFNPDFPILWTVCQFWKFYIYNPYKLPSPKLVKDIGRKWMSTQGYHKVHKDVNSKKVKSTTSFTTWEK